MLVLEAEKVPHEASKHLQRSENRSHYVAAHDLLLLQNERRNPNKAKHRVFNYREVVECL